ncbi:hypothetical protein [Maribellus mangrovi]|uniref:hypothetical protein n=1 Tax=Maribellus mangrovi TaxID=3133146 RepID=UPI0030EDA875
MYRVILAVLLIFLLSCSAQRKLQRTYIGQPLSSFEADFGKPVAILERSEGKVYVYEKVEKLRSTEIGQAKVTLDPMVSPEVTKTEKYYVRLKNDRISQVKLENEYKR